MENIISEQFRLQPQLPMSFELGARPRPPLGIPLEPMDFYSQRLRQLAGATLPPQELLSPPAKRPRVSGVSPPAGFGSPAGPSTSSPGPVRNTPPTGAPRTGATGKPTRKEKPRACEHCHKVFRFQSNLIVHRRIHTGEKPYKCKICSHACTQSSKLKRHMKTHMKELDQISVEKNLQASDDVKEEDEDGSVQEEDEEEEEEEEELLDEDEEGSSEELADMDGPEDLSTKSAASTPVPTSLAAAQNVLPPTPSSEKSSLVGELMDKFGLSNINTYRDAYKQALRESGKEEERTSESDHSDGEARDSEAARESEARESDRNEESEERDSETHDSEVQQNTTFDNGVSEREAPGKDAEKCETKSDSRENELVERRSTIKVREEFGGGLLTQQQPPALDLSRASVLGSFEAAFDPARRLKLGREPDPSMFPNLWLPPMSLPHEFPFPPRGPLPPEFLNHTKASEALKSPQRGLHQAFPLKPGGGDSRVSLDSCSPSPKRSSDRSRRDTCEYCGKVFKNCSNLTVHRRSHTGEKPYHCSMCNYACAQSSKLTRHMKTHGRMGKDVYQCRFCNMPFSVASTLEKHMRKCVVSQNNKTGLLPPVLPGH